MGKPSQMRYASASIECDDETNCGDCILCKAADLLTDEAIIQEAKEWAELGSNERGLALSSWRYGASWARGIYEREIAKLRAGWQAREQARLTVTPEWIKRLIATACSDAEEAYDENSTCTRTPYCHDGFYAAIASAVQSTLVALEVLQPKPVTAEPG